MGREPFIDIVRRGLRWGAYGGLAFYAVANMTGNESLCYGNKIGNLTPKLNLDMAQADLNLNSLEYHQIKMIYNEELQRLAEQQEPTKSRD
jgi:hypothetical protein